MATSPYDQLLVLQGYDTTLDQLRHKHSHHPIRSQIADGEANQAELQSVIDEISGRKHELDRQQKKLDDEVASLDDKRAKIDAKLYNGSVTATKDLLALQDEAAMLLKRKQGIEDEELEVMELVEVVEAELAPVTDTLESLQSAGEEHEKALAVALAEVEVEIEATETQRAEAAEQVPGELLSHYDSLRIDFGGVAVARLVGSSCDGCHMALSAMAIDKIRKLPDDAVVTCDQCGRLLIR